MLKKGVEGTCVIKYLGKENLPEGRRGGRKKGRKGGREGGREREGGRKGVRKGGREGEGREEGREEGNVISRRIQILHTKKVGILWPTSCGCLNCTPMKKEKEKKNQAKNLPTFSYF